MSDARTSYRFYESISPGELPRNRGPRIFGIPLGRRPPQSRKFRGRSWPRPGAVSGLMARRRGPLARAFMNNEPRDISSHGPLLPVLRTAPALSGGRSCVVRGEKRRTPAVFRRPSPSELSSPRPLNPRKSLLALLCRIESLLRRNYR